MTKRWWVALVLVVMLGVTACAGTVASQDGGGNAPGAQEPTVPVVTQAEDDLVLAEAVVQAAAQRVVGVETGGTVLRRPVEEGDVVEEGDLLLQLDPEDAELAVAQAEAALAQAEAELAQLEAGPREVDVAVAEAQVAALQSVVTQTEAERARLYSGATEAQVAAAEADLAAAQAEQLVARMQHDKTMECFEDPNTGAESCPGLGDPEEQARFALQAADAGVVAAEAALTALQGGADADARVANTGVTVAEAQAAVAAAQLEQLKAGAGAEAVAAAEAAVAQAETALALAEVALARTEVRAPIAGTVTQVLVEAGTPVSPGQPVVHLATLEALEVVTVDLTESDVVRLAVDQPATVTIDALPELALAGRVSEIGLEAVDYRGDVTYPVVVVLEEVDPRLRLGMTAEVRIEVE